MKKVAAQMNFPELERQVLEYWKQENIFQKTLEQDAPKGNFVFYEGPPTANGKPGLHHVLARSFKDVIPRYKTMQGFHVERKAGWDTHGLPVELQVEKALGLRSKQDIENIVPGDTRASIIEFNKKCKESVWEYKDLWEKMTNRMGYWVDMEHPYITYDSSYIESVWWQLKQIADAGYLYQGHKVLPYCYRCGTALSSHEVAQGYQTVKDNSVYVKFQVIPGQKIGDCTTDDNTYFLVWTTTPWTLPGNVALAINETVQYSFREVLQGKAQGEKYIFATDRLASTFVGSAAVPVITGLNEESTARTSFVEGKSLIGVQYKPLYDTSDQNFLQIVADDFVNTDSGTGIVHIAPAFGEDDMRVAQKYSLPVLATVDSDGKMNVDGSWDGVLVKKKNDKNRYAVDDLIIEDLKSRGLLFKEELYEHEYPFCWRCDTPLIYYAKPSWFIKMSELREELSEGNKDIQWIPENIKEGRFGEWLRGAKDWAISRERYWGTPLPIWKCNNFIEKTKTTTSIPFDKFCINQVVIGSQAELKEFSGVELEDLHRPYIDDVTWKCECGGTMERVPEVLDVWFDSGAMPLAQNGYIGEGEIPDFPADYISEAIDQTRGWFYTLHAIATLLSKKGVVETNKAYKSVICLGHVMDAQGKKMSKSKGNVIDPFEMFDAYGADALRWFFFSVNQPGLPKRFDPKGMYEVQGRVFRMLWNSYSFFTTYATLDAFMPKEQEEVSNILDQWILAELQLLIQEITEDLEVYNIYSATQKTEKFIDNLSNWYIRRSRKRFWKNENDDDKNQAYQTLYIVLVGLSKLMAPFTPFLSEEIYKNLTRKASVHLAEWPKVNKKLLNQELISEMAPIRHIISKGLELRGKAGIKVRQPLSAVVLFAPIQREDFVEIIKEELNVKSVSIDRDLIEMVELDTNITPELKLEGESREIIRAIQEGRKKAQFNVEDRILLGYSGKENVFVVHQDDIAKEVLATEIQAGEITNADYTETVDIEGEQFTFWLKRS